MTNNISEMLPKVLGLLEKFIFDSSFLTNINLVFGEEKATNISATEVQAAFKTLPAIDIRNSEELKGALGAFSASTGKIYLSETILSDQDVVIRVLLEEIGHYLDDYFGGEDTPGDEGDIFANVVLGNVLDAQTLKSLKTENDLGTIVIDEETIMIEQNDASFFQTFVSLNNGKIGQVDPDTGNFTTIPNDSSNRNPSFYDIAYDGSSLWGVSSQFNYSLYKINVTTGERQFIKNLGSFINSLGFDDQGNLYGVGSDHLYKIDTTTGEKTLTADFNNIVDSSGDIEWGGTGFYGTSRTSGSDTLYFFTTEGSVTQIGSIGF